MRILKNSYLIQNFGAKIIKKAKYSNLPKTIPNDNNSLRKPGNSAKLSSGPIIFPKPGPTTETEVIAAEIDVKKYKPYGIFFYVKLDKKLDYSTHKKGRPLAFRKRPDFKFIFNLIFLD